MIFNLKIDIKNLGKKLRLQQVGLNDLDRARQAFPNEKVDNVHLVRNKFVLRTDKEEFITAEFSVNDKDKNMGVLVFSFGEGLARKFAGLFADEADVGVNLTGNFDNQVGERKYVMPSVEDLKNELKNLPPNTALVYNLLDQDKLRKSITKIDRV